ncbi:hypothetical protein Hanom_Chr01g00091271 [Helianthus anomalus]
MSYLTHPTLPFHCLQSKHHLGQQKISFPLTCFGGTFATHLDVDVHPTFYLKILIHPFMIID